MKGARNWLLRHRMAALAILIAALAVRAIVPAGFMLQNDGRGITLVLCSGYGPMGMGMPASAEMPMAMDMAMPMAMDMSAAMPMKHGASDMHHDGMEKHDPCPYSVLSHAATGGADPVQLIAAIAFIVAAVFLATAIRLPAAPAFLRPPLRAPPATIA